MTRSKEDKAQFVASLRASAEALKDSGVKIPFTLSDSFSGFNCLMILAQKPTATNCAGFHAWREAGRAVNKGAKGLAILIPLGAGDDEKPRFSWRYVFDITDTHELTPSDPVKLSELVGA
jgi:hypothetical protein